MAFHRLLDTWNRDRRLRTEMPYGRRVLSIEHALGGDMTPGRDGHWQRLPLDPEHDPGHDPGPDAGRGDGDVDAATDPPPPGPPASTEHRSPTTEMRTPTMSTQTERDMFDPASLARLRDHELGDVARRTIDGIVAARARRDEHEVFERRMDEARLVGELAGRTGPDFESLRALPPEQVTARRDELEAMATAAEAVGEHTDAEALRALADPYAHAHEHNERSSWLREPDPRDHQPVDPDDEYRDEDLDAIWGDNDMTEGERDAAVEALFAGRAANAAEQAAVAARDAGPGGPWTVWDNDRGQTRPMTTDEHTALADQVRVDAGITTPTPASAVEPNPQPEADLEADVEADVEDEELER